MGTHEAPPGGTTAEAVTATLAPFGVGFPANRRGEHPVGPTAAGQSAAAGLPRTCSAKKARTRCQESAAAAAW